MPKYRVKLYSGESPTGFQGNWASVQKKGWFFWKTVARFEKSKEHNYVLEAIEFKQRMEDV